MADYAPPFTHSSTITAQVAEIAELVGGLRALGERVNSPQLQRGNRIRSIHASLAIEANCLTVEQVSAVIEGKPVLGHPREILEVTNALAAYEAMPRGIPSVWKTC